MVQCDFKTQFGILFDKVCTNAKDGLAKISKYREKQITITRIYKRSSKSIKRTQDIESVRIRDTHAPKDKEQNKEKGIVPTTIKQNSTLYKPAVKMGLELNKGTLVTSPTDCKDSFNKSKNMCVTTNYTRKRPSSDAIDINIIDTKIPRLDKTHGQVKHGNHHDNNRRRFKTSVREDNVVYNKLTKLTCIEQPTNVNCTKNNIMNGKELLALGEVESTPCKEPIPQRETYSTARSNLQTPKFLQVLIHNRNIVKDLYKSTGNNVHKMEFNCINSVLKEVMVARSEALKSPTSDTTNVIKILEFHISYLIRKREEYQKKFDAKYRDKFRWTCAALRRLLEVQISLTDNSHIIFDFPRKI